MTRVNISGIFAEQTLAFAEKCIPAPTAGRKSSDLQAVGQIPLANQRFVNDQNWPGIKGIL